MAEGAWNQTAQLCAVIEAYHAAKAIKFNPDKWHPMKVTADNLPPHKKRQLMYNQVAKMPKTFDEFKKPRGKR